MPDEETQEAIHLLLLFQRRHSKKFLLQHPDVSVEKEASILLIEPQMAGSHLCNLLSNISFRWIRPDVGLTWTDSRVLSSLPNTDLTSICCNLFSLSYFVPFAPHTVYHTLFSTLRIAAVPLSCPRCPNRVRAQREDNRGTWTCVPLFILPIILCYQCTCSPLHFLCYFSARLSSTDLDFPLFPLLLLRF